MKIAKIEQLPNEDVYNMEVETHHNFAVNGGFIVHNCDALRYFCSMRTKPSITPKIKQLDDFKTRKLRHSPMTGGKIDQSYITGGF